MNASFGVGTTGHMFDRKNMVSCFWVIAALALAPGCGAKSGLDGLDSIESEVTSGSGGGSGSSSSSGSGSDSLPECFWSERFGDEHAQVVMSMAVDSSNATYLAGRFAGQIDLGGQTLDSQTTTGTPAFLIKLDAAGKPIWGKVLGAPNDGNNISVAVDPEDNVMVGIVASDPIDFGSGPVEPQGADDVLLAKLTPDGQPLWTRALMVQTPGISNFFEVAIAVDGAGNTAVFANSGDMPYLVLSKIDPAGVDVWSRNFLVTGGSGILAGDNRPAFDAQGNVTIAVVATRAFDWPVEVDFGGGAVESARNNIMVAKFDASGGHLHSRLLDLTEGLIDPKGPYHVWPIPIVAGSGGEVFLAGTFWGTVDFGTGHLVAAESGSAFAVRLDAQGGTVWSKAWGEDLSTRGAALLPGGHLLFSGYLNGSVDFGGGLLKNPAPGADAFVASLDGESGAHRTSRTYPSTLEATPNATFQVGVRADGGAIVAGELYQDLTFCGGTLTSAGDADIVVARIAP